MNPVNVTVYGTDKLATRLDEIEELVQKLRLKLADVDAIRLSIEMQLNNLQDSVLSNSGDITEKV